MLKKILAVLALAIAGVLIYAATKSDDFSIQRSTTIAAAPKKVFGLINDIKAFNSWNPFARKDPAIKVQYEGPASGPGAAYSWESKTMGVGRMEIAEATPSSRVVMQLVFEKPMKGNNRVEFALAPEGGATNVTWSMTGKMPYLHKLMTVFVNMDKMVGADFEAGLATLKAKAETTT
jgi:uncharacterized protein YndB with AHSA1/START domain